MGHPANPAAHLPVAIIGGGPAGALAAAELARAGRPALLFDERLAWEKPCGGGVTDKALREYPFLRPAGSAAGPNWVSECRLTSPRGRAVVFALDRPVAIFARSDLNALLLDRARQAGATLVQDRVLAIEPDPAAPAAAWLIRSRAAGPWRASAVVLAAGARSGFRFGSQPNPGDCMATAGYFVPLERVPWSPHRIEIRFLPGLEGYIWSFPRVDHASIGICGKMGQLPAAELRRRLEAWMDAAGIGWRGAPFYAHLLPAPSLASLRRRPYEAPGGLPWAAIGDAAALVDPITGEGLYYALRSAELLAQAWGAEGSASYTQLLRRHLLPELEIAARIAPRFFHGRFLGAPVLERMALFTRRSRRFRQILCDVFSGAQSYGGLRRRLYRNLAPALWEMAALSPDADSA